jgi:hypothetical protein
VEDLTRPHRDVPILLEELRQADPIRMQQPAICPIPEHLRRGRVPIVEERSPGRIADWKLAVVSVEAHSRPGQSIEVRRNSAESAAIATKFDSHVVGHEKQHIGPSVRRSDRLAE